MELKPHTENQYLVDEKVIMESLRLFIKASASNHQRRRSPSKKVSTSLVSNDLKDKAVM
jgi:hypothetical protein